MKIKILIPIFNDWESILKLLENINSEIINLDHEFTVIMVDDASTLAPPKFENKYDKIKSIKLIRMKENRGHARCNAAGLKYILEKEEFDFVIPMDGDGEDRPEELKNFIESLEKSKDEPIVGKRIKRSEGIIFKSCYFMHKLITSLFTGKTIKYGNYTCLPKSIVQKMVNEKATWSSFSGSLAKVAEKKIEISSIRGARYYGPSKMSFLNLIKHSISIIAVFKFNVLLRSILFLVVYLYLISENISNITLIPFYLIIILNILTFYLSNRENIEELNNSLLNINIIERIK
tara:strand:+ start:827 stop:1696 length:870 start_codon:yes stop_codon:yes gene_type:complete